MDSQINIRMTDEEREVFRKFAHKLTEAPLPLDTNAPVRAKMTPEESRLFNGAMETARQIEAENTERQWEEKIEAEAAKLGRPEILKAVRSRGRTITVTITEDED
ncbi:MAG: hypothetical protein KY475_25515 [Planctomycetes bacterium]|nr:hypothetical protein [Planctomycetota bacterium]